MPEKGRVDYGVEVAQPSLPLPDEKVESLRNYVNHLLNDQSQKVQEYVQDAWKKGFKPLNEEARSTGINHRFPAGLMAYYPLDYIEKNVINEVIHKNADTVLNQLIPVPGKHSGALEFMGTNYANLKSLRSINFNQPFSFSFWIKSLDGGIRGALLTALSDNENASFSLSITNNKTILAQWNNSKNNTSFQILSKETLPANQWTHISLTYNGRGKVNGVELYLDGKQLAPYLRKK